MKIRVARNGKEIGEFDLNQIKSLFSVGSILSSDEVFLPRDQKWLRIDMVPSLSKELESRHSDLERQLTVISPEKDMTDHVPNASLSENPTHIPGSGNPQLGMQIDCNEDDMRLEEENQKKRNRNVWIGILVLALGLGAGNLLSSLNSNNKNTSETEQKSGRSSQENQDFSFVDNRDGQSYKATKIGDQIWMSQNLNFATPEGSACPASDPRACAVFGRLYSWSAVMSLNNRANSLQVRQGNEHIQGICPLGWHVPSDNEWSDLEKYVDGTNAGTKLKATKLWEKNGNGTDSYGFAVYPIGAWLTEYTGVGNEAYFWTASEFSTNEAWTRSFGSQMNDILREHTIKQCGLSLRCIKDK